MLASMDTFYLEFGRALKKRRLAANLTQDDLAARVGLGRTSITNIEKGRQQVSLWLFSQLADAVGADPLSLLPGRPVLVADVELPPELATAIASLEEDVHRQWARDFFRAPDALAALTGTG